MTDERTPDVVTFTFETTVDYVVNLGTGEVKVEHNGELADDAHYVALFCEGEFAGEYQLPSGEVEEDDEAWIEEAQGLLDAAFTNGTVVQSETPIETT